MYLFGEVYWERYRGMEPRHISRLTLLLLLLLIISQISLTGISSRIECADGSLEDEISIRLLWSFNVTGDIFSSPIAGDIDSDGKLEIIVGSDYYLYAINAESGSLLWRIKVAHQSQYSWWSVWTSPVIGDIDNDNELEVVIGDRDGLIYALNGKDGWPEWVYICNDRIDVPPTICDINNNGRYEVIFCAGSVIYCLRGRDGVPSWHINLLYRIVVPPAVGDLNGDGIMDIVVQCENDYVYAIDVATHQILWALEKGKGKEYFIGGNILIADVNMDGTPDVITKGYGIVTYAINGINGSILWSANVRGFHFAAGDIDEDGSLEIVASSIDGLVLINGEDGAVKYTNLISVGSPVLGDVDGDGKLDIVALSSDGKLYILRGNGKNVSMPFNTSFRASPILVNIDSDPSPEIIICSMSGQIFALDVVSKESGERIYWCCERGDIHGTSNVFLIDPDYDMLSTYSETLLGLNASNPDTDGDSLPDGWEFYHGLDPSSNDAMNDPDNDGLTNLEEYELRTDPMNNDTDNDGLLDGKELEIGTNPLNPDSDQDLLRDGEEVRIGTNPLSRDTDGDGLIDSYDPLPTNPIDPPLIAILVFVTITIGVVLIKKTKKKKTK